MSSFMLDYSAKNVWCAKDQDHHYIVKPARINNPFGSKGSLSVGWKQIPFPTDDVYHVYQLGQYNQGRFKLELREGVWQDIHTVDDTQIDVYDSYGIHIPRSDAYILLMDDRNIILAVKQNSRVSNLVERELFIKFYTNAYFGSSRSQDVQNVLETHGRIIKARSQLVDFQNEVLDKEAITGSKVIVLHNGQMIDKIHLDTFVVGDIFEYQVDTSVKEVIDYKVSDLEIFNSKLDRIRKYLLFRSDIDGIIDYRDEIDVWVMIEDERHDFKGVFYHKYGPSSIRMVTHKDYSVPVRAIYDIANRFPDMNMENMYIRLVIRKGGFEQKLTFENNRVHEMRKLPDELVKQSMIGVNSGLDVWQAANLEMSAYNKIMDATYSKINSKLVQDCFGYNAMNTILGNGLQKVKDYNGLRAVKQPLLLQQTSTCFEYLPNGTFLNNHHNLEGSIYTAQDQLAGYIETIHGLSGDSAGIFYDNACVDIPIEIGSVEAYYAERLNDNLSGPWVKAVEGMHYSIVDRQVIWILDPDEYSLAVKFSSYLLFKEITLQRSSENLTFGVTSVEDYCGEKREAVLDIPPEHLDVFLNNKPLIRGLDYIVKWPQVVIVNKEFLNYQTTEQKVHYRARGFCGFNMTLSDQVDIGFVEHGLLSRDNQFDLRDDKNLRMIGGGRVFTREDLEFAEDFTEVSIGNVKNGMPYCLDEYSVPLESEIEISTEAYRDGSKVIDKKVSEYLSLHLPQPDIDEISIIEKRYVVYSPFINKIILDLTFGRLDNLALEEHYSDSYIRSVLAPYEDLLQYDLAHLGFDRRYVKVHPHFNVEPFSLNVYQYNFLTRLTQLYFGDDVDLNQHININS